MERCPNCRARIDGAGPCRRCGMELALLQAVEQAAEGRLARAVEHLARGEGEAAAADLLAVLALRPDALAAQLLAWLDRGAESPAQSDEVGEAHA